MMWQDIIDDAKEEGRQVMIKLLRDMLSPLGTLPDEIIQQIDQEKDLDKLSAWVKLAAKTESLKDFIKFSIKKDNISKIQISLCIVENNISYRDNQ